MENKHRIRRLLDTTKQATQQTAVLEMSGFHTVYIEGVLDILTFSSDLVRILTLSGELSLFGNDFVLTCLSEDAITLSGAIHSIECTAQGGEVR